MRHSQIYPQAILASLLGAILLICPGELAAQSRSGSGVTANSRMDASDPDAITPADLSGTRRKQPPKRAATSQPTPLASENDPLQEPLPALPGTGQSSDPMDRATSPSAIPESGMGNSVIEIPENPDQTRQDTPWNALEYSAEASIAKARTKYPRNRPIHFIIRASWNGRPNEIRVDSPQNLTLLNLRQADAPTTKMHQGQDGRVAMFWTYRLDPMEEGSALIGPDILTATTRSGIRLPAIPLLQQEIIISQKQWGWGVWITIAFGILVAIILAIWGIMILTSFLQRQRYQDAMRDSLPSLSERLLSEIDTLQVSLLQGSSIGYYEKIAQITRQVLRGRGLLGPVNLPLQGIRDHLKSQGQSGPLADRALAILEKCESVAHATGESGKDDREAIAKDLRELILMP